MRLSTTQSVSELRFSLQSLRLTNKKSTFITYAALNDLAHMYRVLTSQG